MTTIHGSTHARHDENLSSPAQLAALRDLLDASRQAVLERADAFVAESGRIDSTSATHGQGETEHTSVDIERQVSRVLAEQARESLVDIDDALARIDDGTYGRCAGCGAAIPVERLFAVPAARFCVTCQAQRASG
jgi:RNA polymerase-binding transcription factor DksA